MCIHNWIDHCLWDNINVRKALYYRVLLKLLSLIQTAFNFCRIGLYLTIQSNRVIKKLPLSLNCFRVHMSKMKNPNHKKAPWKLSSFTTTKWKTSGGKVEMVTNEKRVKTTGWRVSIFISPNTKQNEFRSFFLCDTQI